MRKRIRVKFWQIGVVAALAMFSIPLIFSQPLTLIGIALALITALIFSHQRFMQAKSRVDFVFGYVSVLLSIAIFICLTMFLHTALSNALSRSFASVYGPNGSLAQMHGMNQKKNTKSEQ